MDLRVKNPDRHIYEGWTVKDFVEALEPSFRTVLDRGFYIKRGDIDTRKDVAEWCKNHQPYYKKHIPEVVDYFWRYRRFAKV